MTKIALISVQVSTTLLLSWEAQLLLAPMPTWSTLRSHSLVNRKAGEAPWEMSYFADMQVLKTSREPCLSRMLACLKRNLTTSESNLPDSNPSTITLHLPSLWLPTCSKNDQALILMTTTSDCADRCLKPMTNLMKKNTMKHHSWLPPSEALMKRWIDLSLRLRTLTN